MEKTRSYLVCVSIFKMTCRFTTHICLTSLIIARIITKYCIWFWFILKLFKVFVFLKFKTLVLFSTFCFSPFMTLFAKSWALSKILFLVQASEGPGIPDLTEQQANCCASCSYGTWHWIGVGGTIIVTLAAAITVRTMIDPTVITNFSNRCWLSAVEPVAV